MYPPTYPLIKLSTAAATPNLCRHTYTHTLLIWAPAILPPLFLRASPHEALEGLQLISLGTVTPEDGRTRRHLIPQPPTCSQAHTSGPALVTLGIG